MKRHLEYILIPPLVTTLIIIIVYIIKGIYPFGIETIGYGDLNQVYVTNFSYYIDMIKSLDFSKLIYTDLVYGRNKYI